MFIIKLLCQRVSGIIMPIIRRTRVCTAAYGTVFVLIVEDVECRIEKIVTLLKPLMHPSILTPYAHFFIQSFHKAGNLISEQYPGEPNPLLQMAINPSHPPT